MVTAPEPFYIRQNGEQMSPEQSQEWFKACAEEAKKEGATFARFTVHPSMPDLRLVEAWTEPPYVDGELVQGEPRFALVAV